MKKVSLISPMYKCQDVPMVILGERCSSPCLYCGLQKYHFPEESIIAFGVENVIKEMSKFKGAYFSPVTDCFLPENTESIHYLLEETWKLNPNWVPLVITKQIIPDKTIDLFVKNKDRLVLQISVPIINEEIAMILEPGSISISKRLEMIKNLTSRGVEVITVAMPYFGFDDPIFFARSLLVAGVKRVITATGVLVEGTRRRMLESQNEEIIGVVSKISFVRGQKYILVL